MLEDCMVNSCPFSFEMAPELEPMMELVRSWAEGQPDLLGLVAFGSIARGDPDIYSDFDLVLIADSSASVKTIRNRFTYLFKTEFDFDLDGKRVLFSSRPFVKIEFYVVLLDELVNLKQYFLETRFEDESRAVLFDRDGRVTRQLAEWSQSRNPVDPSSFLKIAHKFLYYYEGFHPPFFRGDVFRAFYQYSFAYFKLATLVGISDGIDHDLHPPRNLHLRVSDSDVQRLYSVAPVMDPFEMLRRKSELFDFFVDIVGRLRMGNEFTEHKLDSLRASLARKYPPFWQLRDLGYLNGIASGVIFRSATLTRYTADECLAWANSVGLRTIVDLREVGRLLSPITTKG